MSSESALKAYNKALNDLASMTRETVLTNYFNHCVEAYVNIDPVNDHDLYIELRRMEKKRYRELFPDIVDLINTAKDEYDSLGETKKETFAKVLALADVPIVLFWQFLMEIKDVAFVRHVKKHVWNNILKRGVI